MIDDAKIRRLLLGRFPQIEPHRFVIDELDWGERYEVIYSADGDHRTAQVVAGRKAEAELADALAEEMAGWFKRPVGRPRKHAA